MAADVDASGDLLLGMLALRQGLIDQVQLLAAFDQWLAAGPRTLGRDPRRAGRSGPYGAVAAGEVGVRALGITEERP